MNYRKVHKFYAKANGYFWLPCPLCGQEFGGHEWEDIDGLASVIPVENHPGVGTGICPDCTLAGKGHRIF